MNPVTALAQHPGLPLVPGVANLSLVRAGGFAEVYRGYQRRFDRWVAVKLSLNHGTDLVGLRRFDRECAIIGRLSEHPNVVTAHESGYLGDSRPYLLTEWCEGGSLADHLSQGEAWRPEAVLDVAVKIGSALSRTHELGIVHRDVKPENILLRAAGEPVLADFGLAVRHDDRDTGPVAVSLTHAPPESLIGDIWTPAGDAYSLGSTLYTLLFAMAPFPAVPGEPPTERATRIRYRRSRAILDPGRASEVSSELMAVVTALLAPDPRDRPSIGAAVQRLGGRSQVLASPSFPDQELTVLVAADPSGGGGAWWRRRRFLATVGAAAFLVGSVGVSHALGRQELTARPSMVTATPSSGPAVASSVGAMSLRTPASPLMAASAPDAPAPSPPDATTTRYRRVLGPRGLALDVPASWTVKQVPGTQESIAVDPGDPRRYLQFGAYSTVNPSFPSQLARVQSYALTQRPGYTMLRLQPVGYGTAADAVDWEYTYTPGGVATHALGTYWRLGDAQFVVYASAPQDRWQETLASFHAARESATPN
jgi:serine/threonine protein kinase